MRNERSNLKVAADGVHLADFPLYIEAHYRVSSLRRARANMPSRCAVLREASNHADAVPAIACHSLSEAGVCVCVTAMLLMGLSHFCFFPGSCGVAPHPCGAPKTAGALMHLTISTCPCASSAC